jgi:hypothetical protein
MAWAELHRGQDRHRRGVHGRVVRRLNRAPRRRVWLGNERRSLSLHPCGGTPFAVRAGLPQSGTRSCLTLLTAHAPEPRWGLHPPPTRIGGRSAGAVGRGFLGHAVGLAGVAYATRLPRGRPRQRRRRTAGAAVSAARRSPQAVRARRRNAFRVGGSHPGEVEGEQVPCGATAGVSRGAAAPPGRASGPGRAAPSRSAPLPEYRRHKASHAAWSAARWRSSGGRGRAGLDRGAGRLLLGPDRPHGAAR